METQHVFKTEVDYLLQFDEICEIFKAAEANKDCVTTKIPFQPNGNTVYVYKLKTSRDTDYTADGYRWRHNGNKLIMETFKKKYYKTVLGDKSLSSKFSKEVIVKRFHSNETPFAIIHYIGDHTLAEQFAHGNKKDSRPFYRTKPSVLKKVTTDLKEGKTPQEVYEKLTVVDNITPESKVEQPRNKKQVYNVNEVVKNATRISKDDLYNLFELSKQDFSETFHKIQLHPEFLTIFGHPVAIALAKRLLRESSANPSLPQLISYDTTFQLGDFFLSPLVFRNTDFNTDPIFPVLFMMHDKKTKTAHQSMWSGCIEKVLNFEQNAKNAAIITDREDAIVSAIIESSNTADNNLFFCENHIVQNVKSFIYKRKGTAEDFAGLRQQLYKFFDSQSVVELNEEYEIARQKWSESFLTYFDDNLKADIWRRCCAFNKIRFAALRRDISATNNISESMNKLIKNKTQWKEMPADCTFICLYQMQTYFLNEFNRGYLCTGNYTLKDNYEGANIYLQLTDVSSTQLEEIVQSIKDKVEEQQQLVNKPDNQRKSQKSLASLVLKNNLIDFAPRLKCFVVAAPFGNKRYCIWLQNGRYVCTCNSKKTCYHILAIKHFNEQKEINTTREFKLTTLKKSRRARSGRKVERMSDISFIAADDSLEKSAFLTETSENRMASTPKKPRLEKGQKILDIAGDEIPEISKISQQEEHSSYLTMPKAELYEKISESPTSLSSYVDLGESTDMDHSVYAESAGSVENDYNLNDKNSNVCNDEQIFDICDPPTDYILFPFDSMESLLPNQWVSSFVIDPLIFEMIRVHKMSRAILYIPSYSFNYADILFYMIRYLYERDATSKSIILTAINLDNNHYITGVILVNLKHIIILDSIKTDARYLKKVFDSLYNIARVVNILSSVPTKKEEYSFYFSADCGTQSNSCDCGIYTILNCLSIVRGKPYVQIFNSDTMRRWVTYIASNLDMSNNGQKIKTINRFQIQKYRDAYYDSVKAEKLRGAQKIEYRVSNTEEITINAH